MKFRILILGSYFLRLFPRKLIIALGATIGWVWFYVFQFRRSQVLENLRLAFGEEKSESELQEIARKNFRHYGLVIVEVLQSLSWKKSKYQREISCDGIEHLQAALAKGQGAYGLVCHLGNWEWIIGGILSRGIPAEVVVKRSKSESIDVFLRWYRENMGVGILYESGSVGSIHKSLGSGHLVGFVLDQFMGPPIGLPVKFFGKLAGTAVGLALLTEKKKAPILPLYSYRDQHDRVRVVVGPELELPPLSEHREDRLYEKTQFFNDVMEQAIRKHPDQWLWLHRRWKAYRGEPRWSPKRSSLFSPASLLFAALLCVGCTNNQLKETPTGIEIPPEPEVSLPESKPAEVSVPAAVPTPKKQPKRNPIAAAVKAPPKQALRAYPPDQIPFEIGERQVLSLHWSALHAGDVRLEVREGFPFKGRPTFRFWGKATTSAVADALYHVDNTIESFVDKEWLLPYRFLLHMVETHQLKETRAAFDHKLNNVHYWSKRLSPKWGNEVQDRVDPLNARGIDMFSALYFARLQRFEKGKAVEIPVYENRQNLVVTLMPVGTEVVHTKAGVFECWKLGVTIKLENVLKPSGDLFLWLSDDFKKYIVKFDAKLKIGSLRGELVSLRERAE